MGHDLDDEELRATRRMFGLDRKENKVISREYVEENYILKQKILQKIWNDLENLDILAEKDTCKEWDNEYYEMLGRYRLAKEIKELLGE